ncbi:MAG: hypothetical protein JWQ94_14 [Tardiphaga sp.]|jgi:uncharacterized DUF497 family protein|nr:hypothetical protein [Tardiphaga sp.]
MAITYNTVKRELALKERKLDFADAKDVFDSDETATFEDERFDYQETVSSPQAASAAEWS